MNKYLYILGLVGTALFSACSTSDDLSIGDSSAVDMAKESVLIYEAGQNSEVPITLGVGQSRGYTRAPIGDESENPTYSSFSTEAGKYLGVFCLATDYQTPYKTNHPIENNWTANDETGLIVRMKNVPATVLDGDVTFKNSDASADQIYYYPMSNWMKYNFYAYYPRENDSKIEFTSGGSGALVKYITIDGSQDVIWGKAHPEKAPKVSSANDAEPFCAKYFQLKKDSIANSPNPTPGNIAALYPKFEFKHLLSQFKFSIVPVDDAAWTAISNADGMSITNMYVSNAISNLQLIVANKANPGTEGRLSKKDSNTDKLYIKADGKDYNLFSSDPEPLESQVSSIAIAATSVSVPGYIMLPPKDVGTEAYELCLEYSIGVTPKEPMKVKLTPPSGGFKAGQVYNIVVKVKLVE